ncbi:CPBP family intramembrane metalloprotease [Candidatus Parcubacteria bacterium]|nr:MAG: CPBP family intramembrane metalloprotease [Candidatus Parcubacteria bacterium]
MQQVQNQQSQKATVFFAVVIATYLFPVILFGVAPLLPSSVFFKYLLTAIGSLVLLSIALLAIRGDTVTLEEIGWSAKGLQKAGKMIVIGWMIWAVLIISINFKMGYPFSDNFESPLPKILVQWCFVGIAEEVLFRGYIFTKLTQLFVKSGRTWSKVAGIVISSFVFATFHIPQRIFVHSMELTPDGLTRQMLPLFLAGALLAWLFLRSQNVLFVGLVHGGMNAPLLGREGDLAPILLFFMLAEVIAWRRRRRINVSDTSRLFKQGEA